MNTKTIVELRRVIRNADSFAEKVDALMTEAGMSRGKAILFLHRHSPEGYNLYMKRRWHHRGGGVAQTL